jgi:uncharacterized protein (TIGR02444 family)
MAETETQAAPTGSPFWRFSLRLYRQPGVADACIALQEEAGVDVNVMLFLLWQASERRALSAAEVADLEARVGPWRETAVVPLRAVRRALKTPSALVTGGTAEAFRNRIKAVELEAERLQQEAMFALAPSLLSATDAAPADAARTNLDAYQAALGTTFPPSARTAVLTAFATLIAPGG